MNESETPDVGADPAILALARVRSVARTEPESRWKGGPRRSKKPRGIQFSGSGPDLRDPQRLAYAIDSWADQTGNQSQLTVAGLTSRWAEIVGDVVASHVTADEYHQEAGGGRLVITADSPGWQSSMKYQQDTILKRIAEELGSGLVTTIEVRVVGAKRRKGWRVQTGRRR